MRLCLAKKMIGNRAEDVAQWYFRLNGFFTIPSYVIHRDYINEIKPHPYAEIDLLAIRMRNSSEFLGEDPFKKRLKDDDIIQETSKVKGICKHLFALIEVTTLPQCKINKSWSTPAFENIEKAIRRMGFADENQVDDIAKIMYENLRWEGKDFVIQFFCVGKKPDLNLGGNNKVYAPVQITFDDMVKFFCERFMIFPQKFPPNCENYKFWQGFGLCFGEWIKNRPEGIRWPNKGMLDLSEKALLDYIYKGKMESLPLAKSQY